MYNISQIYEHTQVDIVLHSNIDINPKLDFLLTKVHLSKPLERLIRTKRLMELLMTDP